MLFSKGLFRRSLFAAFTSAALLGACVHTPDFVTKHGIQVTLETFPGPTKLDLEKQLDLLMAMADQLEATGWSSQEMWRVLLRHPLSMVVVKDPWRCDGFVNQGQWCGGSFTADNTSGEIVIRDNSCLALTAFAHELTHYFRLFIDGAEDYYHEQEKGGATFWGEGGLVREATWAMCTENCLGVCEEVP